MPRTHLLPGWARDYRRGWLAPDVLAGLVIWSVVVPQAVAYAQIAGLPPQAGLMAAPGALLAYALLGTSRSLVVSATTATSALSAAAVGPLAGGDMAEFATLSAGLALVTAAVLVGAGALRLGGLSDFVSKPVMTGFLFGLGLTVTIGQLPAVLGVAGGSGEFFERLGDLLGALDDVHAATLAVGAASIALLIALRRIAPSLPATLVVLAAGIALSAALGLAGHGVDVVGDIPAAYPHPAIPQIGFGDVVSLLGAAFGVLVVSAEAVGVARALAAKHGEHVDSDRDLIAMGASNALAGLSSGFVQSGGASQTAAAENAGGRTQLASLVAAALVVLTGAFLAPLFEDLPQATLAAIVIVAIAGFYRTDEIARFARIRTSALVYALIALAGVLAFGVLPGLLVAAGLSLLDVVRRLSHPKLGELASAPGEPGVWGFADRNPGWERTPGVLVVASDAPIFYANAPSAKTEIGRLVAQSDPSPRRVVLSFASAGDLDVGTLDELSDLEAELRRAGIELRLANARRPVAEILRRGGLTARAPLSDSIEQAVAAPAGAVAPAARADAGGAAGARSPDGDLESAG